MGQPNLTQIDPISNTSQTESEKNQRNHSNNTNTMSEKGSQKTNKSLASSRSLFGKGNGSLFKMNMKSNRE